MSVAMAASSRVGPHSGDLDGMMTPSRATLPTAAHLCGDIPAAGYSHPASLASRCTTRSCGVGLDRKHDRIAEIRTDIGLSFRLPYKVKHSQSEVLPTNRAKQLLDLPALLI